MDFFRSVCILLAVVCSVAYCDNCEEPLLLTNYINLKEFDEAKRLSSVNNSAMNDIAPSFAGYLTVNKKFNSNMFFWYFPAAVNPSDAPVVLYLEGGPGISSFLALFNGNGPFMVNEDLSLSPNEQSWHFNHHLIYFENPVGTGYSFTDDDGYVNNEEEAGADLYEALRQFFSLFSELQSNKFYLSGTSYAGKFIPVLSYTILQRNQLPNELPKINLVGMSIGNGLTDPVHQENFSELLYQLGLVDTNGCKLIAEIEAKGIAYINDQDFANAYSTLSGDLRTVIANLTGFKVLNNYIDPVLVGGMLGIKFVQTPSTRCAIHAGYITYTFSSRIVKDHLQLDVYQSVVDLMPDLLRNYKVQLYNGQLDLLVPYVNTVNYLKHLQFDGAEEYKIANRTIWRVDNEIAGYMKTVGNLTEVLVRNAGHNVIHDQPKWSLNLITQLTGS